MKHIHFWHNVDFEHRYCRCGKLQVDWGTAGQRKWTEQNEEDWRKGHEEATKQGYVEGNGFKIFVAASIIEVTIFSIIVLWIRGII